MKRNSREERQFRGFTLTKILGSLLYIPYVQETATAIMLCASHGHIAAPLRQPRDPDVENNNAMRDGCTRSLRRWHNICIISGAIWISRG